jgi:hypothetical protein
VVVVVGSVVVEVDEVVDVVASVVVVVPVGHGAPNHCWAATGSMS